MLASIGLEGGDYIEHYGPKPEQGGVLLIDEASMVDTAMLSIACEVFDTIILVGDPGQLPPVEGDPALGAIDHFMLTEIHRQAQDSPILQLAYAARDGLQYWRRPLTAYQPAVAVRASYPALDALTGPVIVWTNTAREDCTTRIRTALGYPPECPVVGEPLICRARGDRARVRGFYNNAALWHDDGAATVTSQSNPTTSYTVKGEKCTCQQATFRPHEFCKHVFSTLDLSQGV
jgi:hypothetical protein